MSKQLILGCGATSFITVLLLIILSYSSLQVDEYGLDYSSISKHVDAQAYDSGVHFLGLGHRFIRFPKTVKSIEFSLEQGANTRDLESRTLDGLQATKYTANNFFVDRFKIGTTMQDELNKYFQKEFSATIEFFQLRKVDLPDLFENSIQETEVKKQAIQKAQAQKQKTQVELETKLMQSKYQAQVVKNLAQGDAQSIVYKGQAQAQAYLQKQQSYSTQYSIIKQNLQLDNAGLIQFMKNKIIKEYDGQQLVINLDNSQSNQK
ncbi:hypothetical protein IMG5_132970 [Ichthyophthirius multifiliis]|uniref:Band 7 domain-containing protein n=1 Tax=Ichthyophthirius multifiliis TaxID=5932 RepID=G0QWK3_ICHMU|nr:hypothetical protein IMG5_132970 [Ichthyophthirius multifiliis]EGR30398.1 hypothetical protein IMG5_132970 [Ichthyophthirius multifiliis]|eukprot:XP_004031985.1 hypothetical protein IMG5_132970 [Ichthyophthirius multifiliis]